VRPFVPDAPWPQSACDEGAIGSVPNADGTTRSRVSHFMNKFRHLGFIDYNGHLLEVHSSLLSVVLAEQSRTVEAAALTSP
jgi:hypothetical protein